MPVPNIHTYIHSPCHAHGHGLFFASISTALQLPGWGFWVFNNTAGRVRDIATICPHVVASSRRSSILVEVLLSDRLFVVFLVNFLVEISGEIESSDSSSRAVFLRLSRVIFSSHLRAYSDSPWLPGFWISYSSGIFEKKSVWTFFSHRALVP